jgi:HD-like signal output (HDOD) protein
MTPPNTIIQEADVPSPSPVIHRLLEMMFDPDTSLDDLALTLSSDAGLSARTLRAANAACSSSEQRIENVRDAVVRIGLVGTIHLISTAEIKAVFLAVPGQQGDMKRLWVHNLVTACLADAYARFHRLEKPGRWSLPTGAISAMRSGNSSE